MTDLEQKREEIYGILEDINVKDAYTRKELLDKADSILELFRGYGKMVDGEERTECTFGEFGGKFTYKEQVFQPLFKETN